MTTFEEVPESANRSDTGVETINISAGGKESLFRITMFGLTAQQLVPGLALAGGYLVLYSGNASWLAMLISGLAALCICVAVNVFARRHVVTGSLLSYVGLALGRVPQRIVAAAYLLGYVIAAAAMVTSVVIFTSSFLQSVGVSFAAAGWFQGVSAVVIALLAGALTYRGLDTSIVVASVLAFLAFPLIAATAIGAAVHDGVNMGGQLSLQGGTSQGLIDGVIVALAFFVGFDGLAALSAETREPLKNIARMLNLVLWICLLGFIVVILITIPALTLHSDQLAAGSSPTALLSDAAGMGWLQKPIDLLLIAATFASVVALLNFAARIVATAGTDGYLPRVMERVHPRYGSPTVSTIVLTAFSAVIPVGLQLVASAPPLKSSTYLFTLYSLFWVVPYVLIALAAIAEMRKAGRIRPVAALISLIGAGMFVYFLVYSITNSAGGVLGAMPYVMLGMLVFGFVGFSISDARRQRP